MDQRYSINKKMSNKRIFIVEDDTMNRVVYMMAFKMSGAILEFDNYGRATRQKMEGFNPDLILLDLMLPNGVSGFDVFSEIKQNSEYRDVPIIAISASEPAIAVPKCQSFGFNGFISKPIDPDLLVDQLVRAMSGENIWYMGERYGGELKNLDRKQD